MPDERVSASENSDLDPSVECRFCTGIVPARARNCKHCGEWLTEAPSRPPSRALGQSRDDDRVICAHCDKRMVPRIITGSPLIHGSHGWTPVPKKAICPFCGGLHRKFPASTGERAGAVVFAVIFFGFILLFVSNWK